MISSVNLPECNHQTWMEEGRRRGEGGREDGWGLEVKERGEREEEREQRGNKVRVSRGGERERGKREGKRGRREVNTEERPHNGRGLA